MKRRFDKSFTQQEPLPQAAIDAAVDVMRHGRLHRYNCLEGETAETSLLESEFAEWSGARHCLAVASGGYAMTCVLRALGTGRDEPVLTNAFTLAPVPGAIAATGARPVFVESTPDLVIDFDDLSRKMATHHPRTLLLSHMRGHICDMDRLMAVCDSNQVTVVEDCAHTMGAQWNGTMSGRHGHAACFSTQTYKHINSGEGGLIISDDGDLMARAVLLSGSYMFYDRHDILPDREDYRQLRLEMPNMSGRMDNLRAAILRPQLALLDERCREWTRRYRIIESTLAESPSTITINRPDAESFVGSSIQFRLRTCDDDRAREFLAMCSASGVSVKWFGDAIPSGYTSRYDSWSYCMPQSCPRTDATLGGLFDMRIPLTFTLDDCHQVADLVIKAASKCKP